MAKWTACVATATLALVIGMPADARSTKQCRAIADPTARLACYDAQSGARNSAPPVAAPEAPAPAAMAAPTAPTFSSTRTAPTPPSASAAVAPDANLKHRDDFDSQVASVEPLTHGYYRIRLADGTAYDTTQLVLPPHPGEAAHYRRTFLGTMFLDMPGRGPITVRLARRQQDD